MLIRELTDASPENGPIKIGDYLVPSFMPGVAMHANGVGAPICIALPPFDAEHQEAWNQNGKFFASLK